jgi:hypothetical protein
MYGISLSVLRADPMNDTDRVERVEADRVDLLLAAARVEQGPVALKTSSGIGLAIRTGWQGYSFPP